MNCALDLLVTVQVVAVPTPHFVASVNGPVPRLNPWQAIWSALTPRWLNLRQAVRSLLVDSGLGWGA